MIGDYYRIEVYNSNFGQLIALDTQYETFDQAVYHGNRLKSFNKHNEWFNIVFVKETYSARNLTIPSTFK